MSASSWFGGGTRQLALGVIYIALYVAMVATFPFISFMALSVRVANVLRGMLGYFPRVVIVGNLIAVFLANFLLTPLGLYDVVLSPIVTTVTITLAWVIGNFGARLLGGRISYFIGFGAHACLQATYLSWLLSFYTNVPFLILFPLILAGNTISDLILPYALHLTLAARLKRP
jgi:uncharacterized membrane protein